jgi:hypothetical protein
MIGSRMLGFLPWVRGMCTNGSIKLQALSSKDSLGMGTGVLSEDFWGSAVALERASGSGG